MTGVQTCALPISQLERADEINDNRRALWERYYQRLKDLPIDLPCVPDGCSHNGHIFYIKVDNLKERQRAITYLNEHGIGAVFHYVPLHSSEGGRRYGRFFGEDCYTTKESERLIRMPMWYGIKEEEFEKIVRTLEEYFLDSVRG